MFVDPQWLKDTYDRIVAAAGDEPLTVKEIREALASAYADAVKSGELERPDVDLFDEGIGLFDRVIMSERNLRKQRLQKEFEYVIDCLNDETILGRDDPMFTQAYPLGNGSDKTLGMWTGDDMQFAIVTRYRKASESTAAAAAFDQAASPLIRAMMRRSVIHLRDLVDSPTNLDNT